MLDHSSQLECLGADGVTASRNRWIPSERLRLMILNGKTMKISPAMIRGSHILAITVLFALTNICHSQDAFAVHIRVDATRELGELRQIWRFFGADEPNYAYMPHGSKLLGELGELRAKQIFFRAHNLLTSGDGTPALKWGSTNVYTEDVNGRPVYDWTIVDRIFDTYLERGVRPYAQIGFMPKALSSKPEPYQHRWRVGAPMSKSTPAGRIHPRITTSGVNWFINGSATASSVTAPKKSRHGIGKRGMNPTLRIGKEHLSNSTSCTTMPSQRYDARCPAQEWAAPMSPDTVADLWKGSLTIV